jgi:hypothetical protein
MELMLLTDAVFHREMSWLKLDAEKNMDAMMRTLCVFQLVMSWLKEVAQ